MENFSPTTAMVKISASSLHGMDGSDTSLYEMTRYVRFDLARVWRPTTSYGVHTLLFLGQHLS